MNIFIAKLSSHTTSEDLTNLFSQYGEVSSAKVITDRDTGSSKCFGFVEMSDDSAGQTAIDALDNTEFQEKTIVVKKAHPRESRPSSGGYNRHNNHR
ncbi:MAG: RNA-binding protein [Bacteroidales bacterium]|nr:RNA-binding protein [Bacteroidales bacterium]NLK80825.1 RNA-binding protein [Bacteroidales bacterium]HPY82652.1 RNA-binding protein [Bacteroidales bacterium]